MVTSYIGIISTSRASPFFLRIFHFTEVQYLPDTD